MTKNGRLSVLTFKNLNLKDKVVRILEMKIYSEEKEENAGCKLNEE